MIGILMILSALFYLLYPLIPGSAKSSLYLNQCLFKSATGLPCPGCGYDRGLNLLLDGQIYEAFMHNLMLPFFIILPVIFIVVGVQIIYKGHLISVPKKYILVIVLFVAISWILKFVMGSEYY